MLEQYQPALLRFCHRLTGSPAPAQDLAQETLLRAVESLVGLQEPSRFEAWLFGIAANLAKRWWRRQARWPLSLDSLAAAYPDVAWATWPAAAGAGVMPDQRIEQAEQTARIQAAIESLPAALGRVLVLHYLAGWSYAEIAAALEVPVSTVKGRLFKSRARLHGALAAAGIFPHGARRVPQQIRFEKEHTMGTDAADLTGAAGVGETAATAATGSAADGPAGVSRQRRLVPVSVDSIRANKAQPIHMVVLKDQTAPRYLSIVIGVADADAMAVSLNNASPARPLSHDLMVRLLEAGNLRVQHVAVTHVVHQTFHASVSLRRSRGSAARAQEVDARPSDAINLALRTGAPVYVAEHLLSAPTQPPPDAPFTFDLDDAALMERLRAFRPTQRLQKAGTAAI
ncbi:MAG TPA: bifunctional nuclease domain-containing protein, partial [Gemmatimonadales bacterium]|nr:bifunctional nuclease domain-containing protein [Gemmatimonadales bacterium]